MSDRDDGGWGAWVTFAGVMMMLLGGWHAISGLGGIVENEFLVATPNYIFEFDVTTWGWVHLILGVFVALAGYFVIKGALWARMVGILLVVIGAIVNFLYLPVYPIWGIIMIVVDVTVIYALATYEREPA
jgi:hypothetical protein